MSTRLIFIRHGFSLSNKLGEFTGQADSALSDLGIKQAKCAAQYLKDEKIDKIYSSPLSRAYDTAMELSKVTGLEIIKEEGLCEIDGGKWTNIPYEKIAADYPYQYDLWKNDMYNAICPNGESIKEFFLRVKETVTKIAKENDNKTISLVTHATPIRVISCLSLGKDPKDIRFIPWSQNASINIIDYENSQFKFIKKDITEHLKGIETSLPSII